MAIFQFNIRIIGRSKGKSAVCSAAYNAGEKIYNEETGLFVDHRNKLEVRHKKIMLPENAPKRLSDRSVLWNEVQKVEQKYDAQLCRSLEIALPFGLTWDQCIKLVEEYCQENFVDKGMIVDYCIHAKKGNPHLHILLTMRGFDDKGNWNSKFKTAPIILEKDCETKIIIPKSYIERSTEYQQALQDFYDENDLDITVSLVHDKELDKEVVTLKPNKEYTEDIKVPDIDPATNRQKIIQREGKGIEHRWYRITVPSNNWSDKGNAEIWRASWAEHCNKYLPEDQHIDHRSYKRQGLDIEPQIHEGWMARHMEENGQISDRCQINREIRERNSIRKELKKIGASIIKRMKAVMGYAGILFDGNRRNTRSTAGYGNSDGNTTTGNRISSEEIGRDNNTIQSIGSTKDFSKNIKVRIDNIKQRILQKEKELSEKYPDYLHKVSANTDAIDNKSSDEKIVKPSKQAIDIQNLLAKVQTQIQQNCDHEDTEYT